MYSLCEEYKQYKNHLYLYPNSVFINLINCRYSSLKLTNRKSQNPITQNVFTGNIGAKFNKSLIFILLSDITKS